MKLPIEYESQGADFDEPERIYRYSLHRMWGGGSLSVWRTVLWIMLNPSTADERVLDPTLRKCERFSMNWGFDGFEVVNLFALRATDPAALSDHPAPIGQGYGDRMDGAINDGAICDAAERADLIVCGWGAEKIAQPRAIVVRSMLRAYALECLGINQDGSPKHPLYLPYATARRHLEAIA